MLPEASWALLTGQGCSCNGQVTGKIRLPGLKGPGDIYITTLLLPPSPFQAAASREPAWVAMCHRRRQSWDLLSKISHHKAIEDSLRRADQRATLSCTQGRNHRVPIPALRQSQTCSDVSTQGWAKMPQRRTTAKKSSSLQQLAGRPSGNCCLALMGVSSESSSRPPTRRGIGGCEQTLGLSRMQAPGRLLLASVILYYTAPVCGAKGTKLLRVTQGNRARGLRRPRERWYPPRARSAGTAGPGAPAGGDFRSPELWESCVAGRRLPQKTSVPSTVHVPLDGTGLREPTLNPFSAGICLMKSRLFP